MECKSTILKKHREEKVCYNADGNDRENWKVKLLFFEFCLY
jgi:hypothetical protein